MRSTNLLLAIALLAVPSGTKAETEVCIESYGTALPTQIIVDQLNVDADILLWTNIWGMRGYANDNYKQCLFEDGSAFGWTWTKAETDPVCAGPSCPGLACMYQFSFGSMEYGISPWGTSSGAANLPVRVNDLASLLAGHDIAYEAVDEMPGSPGNTYARHSLVYDLFLSTGEPQAGVDISATLTDEIIIMMNFNPEYPDVEACSSTASDPIEANAVFDGYHWYDYHSFESTNPIAGNYHQFRRVGGDAPGASVPTNLDIAPFLEYLKSFHNDHSERWLGKITIGSQLYDHTTGSVTFQSHPTFQVVELDEPRVGRKASLALQATSDEPGKNRLSWKMSRGDAITLSDLGDPTATTAYQLTVEADGLVLNFAIPTTSDLWEFKGSPAKPKGYFYKDKIPTNAGISKIQLKIGADGKSKVRIKGKGAGLGLPPAFDVTFPLTVTLSNSLGVRWRATYDSAATNDSRRIKAKY